MNSNFFDKIESAAQRYYALEGDPVGLVFQAVVSGDLGKVGSLDEIQRYATRLMQLGRPDIAGEIVSEFSSSASASSSQSALERIIEQNELMAAAFFARGVAASRATARVVIRNDNGNIIGFGTGFMISPKLFMTNNHVIDAMTSAKNSIVQFDYALDATGQPMVVQSFDFEPETFFATNKPLDFTIVALKDNNIDGQRVADRGWLPLIANSGKAVVGEPINIVQHPGGRRQQIAIRNNRVVRVKDDFLLYTTDTLGGSSGSACVNDQWQLAALHHAGVPKRDAQGRWLKKDGTRFIRGQDDPGDIQWIANEGVRISSIVREMRARRLSPAQREMFENCFEAPMGIENSDDGQSMGQSPSNGTMPPSNSVDSQGIARWNFQLAFGPLGNDTGHRGAMSLSHAPSPPSVPNLKRYDPVDQDPTSPSDPVLDPQLGIDAKSAQDGQNETSVFDKRGDYFDPDADAMAIEEYYAGIDRSTTKAKLFDSLSALVQDTHAEVLSYWRARHNHLYPWIDRHPDQKLRSVYSSDAMNEAIFVHEIRMFRENAARMASSKSIEVESLQDADLEEAELALEAQGAFNCEHVVPQSWFEDHAEERAQKSDLHHLFTCDWGCNSFRNNIPYFEFSEAEQRRILSAEVSEAEALLDTTKEAVRFQCGLRDGRRFEPSAGKGAVARATLYFLLRYPGAIGDVKRGDKKELTKSNHKFLLDWAKCEAPDEWEKHRNAEIAKIQGNRNPLIDFPELVDKIAFSRGFG